MIRTTLFRLPLSFIAQLLTHENFTAHLRGILIAVLLTSIAASTYGFGVYLFPQLINVMREDLHFDYQVVGTITAAAQGCYILFSLCGTWLARRIGGSQILVGSLASCGLLLIMLPLTSNIWLIGLILALMGGLTASVWVPMAELISLTITYENRGKVLSLISSGTSYGVFINSLLVPWLVTEQNWQTIWYAVGAGTLVLTLVTLLSFRRLGLFFKANLAQTTLPDTDPPAIPQQPRTSWGKRLLNGLHQAVKPWVVTIWILTFVGGFCAMPFQNYLSPYLLEEVGVSSDLSSQIWGMVGFTGMFSGLILGTLSDKAGVRTTLALCYACLFLAGVLLVTLPTGYYLFAASILFAVAYYPIFGLIPAYTAKKIKDADSGTITLVFGVSNVTLGLGGMMGNLVGGMLKESTGSFFWTYVVVIAAALTLALLSQLLPDEHSA